ncbi:exonuclease SbcCD subunit D [Chloroflexota bacterium]
MKILHFADLHLGVETYGHIDPASGLSSRFLDSLSAFDHLVDYAMENSIDLVLFCGDAYKSREPTQTQQREFARRINRLATSQIPTVLLVGNHDCSNAIGRATSVEIFGTLDIKNVYVFNRPDIYQIPTRSGIAQIVSLPWLRRSAVLSKEDAKNLEFDQIKQNLEQVLTNIITTSIPKLDPTLPAILAGHVWVSGAQVGTEKQMTIGQDHALLVSNIAQPAFNYIALGHIHRHQVLHNNPPVVYAGSLQRLDFGDEEDEKGFYIVDIEPDPATGKRRVSLDFHPVPGRRFLTINVALEPSDPDPTTTVLGAIAAQEDKTRDAIVRLNLSLPAQMEGQLRDNDLRNILKETHYVTIARETKRETRLRLGNRATEELTPIDALKAYLEAKKVSAERSKVLLEYGEKLIKGEKG